MTESNPLCERRTGGANVTNLHSDYNSPETEVAQHGHRLGRNDRSGAGFTNRDERIYSLFGGRHREGSRRRAPRPALPHIRPPQDFSGPDHLSVSGLAMAVPGVCGNPRKPPAN